MSKDVSTLLSKIRLDRIPASAFLEEKGSPVRITIEKSQTTQDIPQNLWDRIRGKPVISRQTFFVTLHIRFTNQEIAIGQTYTLGDLVLEEYVDPLMVNPLIEELNATPPFDTKKRESLKYRIKLFSEPVKITLAQFGSEEGFIRGYPSLREATDYVQFLKTNILPQIKQALEHYGSSNASSETFEL